jgi:hypothetical protein
MMNGRFAPLNENGAVQDLCCDEFSLIFSSFFGYDLSLRPPLYRNVDSIPHHPIPLQEPFRSDVCSG